VTALPAQFIPEEGRRWDAALDLDFAPRPERTVLADVDFSGPLRVQRPFYPEGAPCHCYLLHPPGGLVSGDRLRIRARVRPGAHAVLTTPSAGKVYRADVHGHPQGQDAHLTVDGTCEWLPQETIVFDGPNAAISTRVDLAGQARFIGWEIVCLGRAAGEKPYLSGSLDQRFEVRREGRLILRERFTAHGGDPLLTAPSGLAGRTVSGTLLAVVPGDGAAAALDELRAMLPAPAELVAAATCRSGVLALRALGHDAARMRELFCRAWQVLRPALLGRPACPPRIWNT